MSETAKPLVMPCTTAAGRSRAFAACSSVRVQDCTLPAITSLLRFLPQPIH